VRWVSSAGLSLLLASALGHAVQAADQKQAPPAPAVISADRLSYDEELGLVVASGHVEISQNDRILLADTVTYNQRTDTVTASGHVSLLDPTGNVAFANYFELTGGLKDGVAQNFRLLMQDNSRFAATGARRTGGGTLTEMAKGVFSPCDLCKDNPENPPLWQIKANKIIHDNIEHEIYYEDADLEMYGIPVAYTPYLSTPDPTVKRRSGFLIPTYGSSPQIGYLAKIPYFWAIEPDKDLTIAPVFATDANPVFDAEYRQRWGNGKLSLEGSITDASALNESGNSKPGNQIKGHVRGQGVFNIDENWRTGFNVERETDDTYLSLYKVFGQSNFNALASNPAALAAYNPTLLITNPYLEGFFGRSYNSLNAYAFQDTRASVSIKSLPIVAPTYQYNYVSEAGSHGQRWTVNASALDLFRESGVDQRRLAQQTKWELPYTSPIGDNYLLTLSLETDGYATEHYITPVNPTGGAESSGRVLPQGKFEWRYPWVRQDGEIQEVLEPRVAFIAGPQSHNSGISNEDSLDFEFNDLNLYSLNPFPGTDRTMGGERVVYGASASAYGSHGGSTSLFLGQLYNFHHNNEFDSFTGLQENLSDYVGRLEVKPSSYLNLVYRFRMAQANFAPNSTEVSATAGPSNLQVSANYVQLKENLPGTGVTDIKQLYTAITPRINQYWTSTVYATRDVAADQFLNYGVVATYADECFTFRATAARNYTYDRTVKPGTVFLFQFIFKYLGAVQAGGSQ